MGALGRRSLGWSKDEKEVMGVGEGVEGVGRRPGQTRWTCRGSPGRGFTTRCSARRKVGRVCGNGWKSRYDRRPVDGNVS